MLKTNMLANQKTECSRPGARIRYNSPGTPLGTHFRQPGPVSWRHHSFQFVPGSWVQVLEMWSCEVYFRFYLWHSECQSLSHTASDWIVLEPHFWSTCLKFVNYCSLFKSVVSQWFACSTCACFWWPRHVYKNPLQTRRHTMYSTNSKRCWLSLFPEVARSLRKLRHTDVTGYLVILGFWDYFCLERLEKAP